MLAAFLTVSALMAILLAIGVIALFYWACKSFEGIFALVLFLFCLDAVFVGLPVLSLGKNIQAFDPLAVVVFLAGISRLAFGAKKHIGLPQWLLISLFVLMIVPLGLGFKQYGMAAAPDFRWFFHFMAFALYASSFDFEHVQFHRLVNYTMLAAGTITALVYFRWAAETAGLAIANTWFHVGAGRRFRVLNATQTYFLAQATLLFLMTRVAPTIALSPQISPTRVAHSHTTVHLQQSSVAIAGLGLVTSIALMHRSVWVSTLSGVALLAFLQPELRKVLARILLVSVILAFLVLVPLGLLGYLDTFLESLFNSVTEVGEHHSTFADRYVGWYALLHDWWRNGNPLTYAIGKPFGSGYYRRLTELGIGIVAEYTPHNFYVQTLLRTGFMGVTIFVSMIVSTGIGVYRSLSGTPRGGATTIAFRQFLLLSVVMQATFMLVYGAPLEQGLIFGLAMASTQFAQHPPRHRPILNAA